MNGVLRLALTALAAVPMVGSTLAVASTEPSASWAISNAPVVGYEAFPAFVQVVTRHLESGDLTYCSGTLLAKDAVLTSSECLRDTSNGTSGPYKPWPVDQFTVYHPLTGERMGATAVHYPTPEAFFPENPADLAILKLFAPLDTDARVTIPTQGLPFIRQGQGTVWGSGAQGHEPFDEILTIEDAKLRKASVPFRPSEACSDHPRLSYMLCAEADNPVENAPHTCEADEGSPLMILSDDPAQAIQVGLTGGAFRMYGDPARCDEEPVFYTNLTSYSDWIASIVPTVSRKPYGLQGPGGPPVAADQGQTPKPATSEPSRQLSCGDVVEAGTQAPTELVNGMEWVPPRGPGAGSDISVVASKLTWGVVNEDPATHVVIAGECAWADALPSNGLTTTGPLLLTDSNTLEPSVSAEIDRLKVRRAIIVGGPKAVSPAVEQALTGKGLTVRRFQGETRLETAVEVAKEATNGNGDIHIYLARAHPAPGGSPSQAFADAIGAAFGVTHDVSAVLLTEHDKLSEPTAKWVAKAKPYEYSLMGGEQALGRQVEHAINPNNDPNIVVTRYAGNNRAHTTALLSKSFINSDNTGRVKGIMILDGQGDDAWKTGFVFGGPAAWHHFVYGLAAGDEVPEETKDLIRLARSKNLAVYCVASAKACTTVRNTH